MGSAYFVVLIVHLGALIQGRRDRKSAYGPVTSDECPLPHEMRLAAERVSGTDAGAGTDANSCLHYLKGEGGEKALALMRIP